MRIKERIREWLGINDIRYDLAMLDNALARDVSGIKNSINTILPGLGRVISKLDTQYGRAEIDSVRKAESDKLTQETIKRLEAEAKAREPYNLRRKP